ncbi:MAG: hypothetical protein CM15mV28_1800 [Thaumasvirus sp.]|nr:MAG: hypothetical protein CM15mV28_1800 [Thaumasvirus sp.]
MVLIPATKPDPEKLGKLNLELLGNRGGELKKGFLLELELVEGEMVDEYVFGFLTSPTFLVVVLVVADVVEVTTPAGALVARRWGSNDVTAVLTEGSGALPLT